MPLITGCNYPNPVNIELPAVPIAVAAPNLAPMQGDHLFGDIIGSIETALQSIFGGGANWQTRMRSFNPTLATLWQGLGNVDFGHNVNPLVIQRAGVAEPDEHSVMFGGYSRRLQWHLCEIVCTGFDINLERRKIGGATRAWKKKVLASFDDLMNNLVDRTALAFYIATPNLVRLANAVTARHPTLSLALTRNFANTNHGPGKNRVIQVLARYDCLRGMLEGLLHRLDGSVRVFNPVNNTWR